MIEKEVVIKNRAGLHARPAALLVQTANKFNSSIMLEKEHERINGKSIMGVISLGATYKTCLKVVCDGDDEQEAAAAIKNLFDKKFEED